MTARQIAQRIPAEYRREILTTNMIAHAVSTWANTDMYYLATIWENYIEPGQKLDTGCNVCLERVLNNYRQLQSVLIELEKENSLLHGN